MTEQRITSRKNPLLQQVKKLLSSRKAREEAGLFAADGVKLLGEAVRWYPGLDTVILSEGVHADVPESVRLFRVPEDVMASISPMESPQGALFLCRLPEKKAYEPHPGCLLLDGIQDPGNLGTILRTADALDIPVTLLEGCADPKTISDQNRINAFESFYTDQLKHRATLLKRIAGENAESFLELNMDYDLATVEKMELEAKKNRHKIQREAAARRKRDSGTERDQQTQEHPAKGLGGIYVQRLGGETALHPLAAIFLEHRVKALLLIHGSIPHFCCVWVECAVLHMTKV